MTTASEEATAKMMLRALLRHAREVPEPERDGEGPEYDLRIAGVLYDKAKAMVD